MEFFGEKLVIKMWDTLMDRGMGGLLAPWQAKKMGKAAAEIRRDEMIIIAETEAKISAARKSVPALHSPIPKQLEQKSFGELLEKEGVSQPAIDLEDVMASVERADLLEKAQGEINVSRAVMIAEKELLFDDTDVPDEVVQEDWFRRWRDSVRYVRSENLQTMWGKILAGEVKNPGTYSIRVLELMSSLSEKEAATISLVAQYLIQNNIHRDQLPFLETKGISLGVLLELQSIGILVGADSVSLGVDYPSLNVASYQRILRCNNKGILVEHEDRDKKMKFQTISATGVGQKLIELGNFEADPEYLRRVSQNLIESGYKVRIGDCKKVGEQLKLSNLIRVDS